jgi:hypothetical protein
MRHRNWQDCVSPASDSTKLKYLSNRRVQNNHRFILGRHPEYIDKSHLHRRIVVFVPSCLFRTLLLPTVTTCILLNCMWTCLSGPAGWRTRQVTRTVLLVSSVSLKPVRRPRRPAAPKGDTSAALLWSTSHAIRWPVATRSCCLDQTGNSDAFIVEWLSQSGLENAGNQCQWR